jgi:THAP4-like, heme-binding beta-barrel domain
MVALVGASLHPDLAPVEFLLGTWAGTGSGSYPGSEPFAYDEELTLSHSGKPVAAYAMKTWRGAERTVSHSESGFWRCHDVSQLDTVVAHATGHVEISTGSIKEMAVDLNSSTVVGWRGAKEVLTIRRRLFVDRDVLVDELDMEAVGHELQAHVVARLHRI